MTFSLQLQLFTAAANPEKAWVMVAFDLSLSTTYLLEYKIQS